MVDRQVKLIYAEVKVGDEKIPLLTLHTLLYSKMKMESKEHTKCSSTQTNSHNGTQKRIKFQITPVLAKMPGKSALFILFLRANQYKYNQQDK